jgi:hypothetical protein
MNNLRIRWSAAWKLLLGVGLVLLALQVAPSLLRPPEAPPLEDDVGLPRVIRTAPERSGLAKLKQLRPKRNLGRVVSGRGDLRRAEAAEGRARTQRPHRPGARSSAQRKEGTPTRGQDPPAKPVSTTPFPAPEPSTPPEAPPPSAAAPPNDGSIEFAPH